MSLFKKKEWPVGELVVFKVTCILFGMIIGTYAAGFIRQFLFTLFCIAFVGWARVSYFYFLKK